MVVMVDVKRGLRESLAIEAKRLRDRADLLESDEFVAGLEIGRKQEAEGRGVSLDEARKKYGWGQSRARARH